MPQQSQPNPSQKKKKKNKGPVPAHQNKFAFQHNPKSKTTAKILASPNTHVCRRCHDKIEWRKQYRKYKPRTQPGICNGCKKRNVLAAYHTICESCTIHSTKAKEVLKGELASRNIPHDDSDNNQQYQQGDTDHLEIRVQEKEEECNDRPVVRLRACAICVKEIALPDPEDENNDNSLAENMGRIRLRERKAIERQSEKVVKKTSNSTHLDETTEQQHQEEEGSDNDDNEGSSETLSVEDTADSDDDDPFLKAVGGADKLLIGEAYQQRLLAQAKEQQQQLQRNQPQEEL